MPVAVRVFVPAYFLIYQAAKQRHVLEVNRVVLVEVCAGSEFDALNTSIYSVHGIYPLHPYRMFTFAEGDIDITVRRVHARWVNIENTCIFAVNIHPELERIPCRHFRFFSHFSSFHEQSQSVISVPRDLYILRTKGLSGSEGDAKPVRDIFESDKGVQFDLVIDINHAVQVDVRHLSPHDGFMYLQQIPQVDGTVAVEVNVISLKIPVQIDIIRVKFPVAVDVRQRKFVGSHRFMG